MARDFNELILDKMVDAKIASLKEYQKDLSNPKWSYIFIDGDETEYLVSTVGDIMHGETRELVEMTVNDNGYKECVLKHGGENKTMLVHIIVANAYVMNTDNKITVFHIDKDKSNNWYRNLKWMNGESEGFDDIIIWRSNTRLKPGVEPPYRMTLTEKDIHEVCRMIEAGYNLTQVRKKLNVSEYIVTGLKYGGLFPHISSLYTFKGRHDIDAPNYYTGREIDYTNLKPKIYTKEDIHKVCKMMEAGVRNKHICEEMGMKNSFIANIKRGKIWRHVSSQYDIKKGTPKKRPPGLNDGINALIEDGITDNHEICRLVGLPDNSANCQYVSLQKTINKKAMAKAEQQKRDDEKRFNDLIESLKNNAKNEKYFE